MLNDLLNVAPGSISDVPADDLGSLWTVFTKVKGNIKDGQRLENLSWRLWYREILSSNHLKRPSNSSPFLDSPPTQQPSLITDAETISSESDDLATDVEPLDFSPLPSSSSPPLAASHSQSSLVHALPAADQAAILPPVSSTQIRQSRSAVRRRRGHSKRLHNSQPSSGSPVVRPHVHDRSNSTPTQTGMRFRRPPSFNLGQMIAAPVPELRSHLSSNVNVLAPSTPPTAAIPPTVFVLQPTPRPTPPESPRVPMYKESRRSDSLLPVPQTGSPSPTATMSHEVPPEITTAGPGPPRSAATMAPVPVDDCRSNRRRTFFFKESPGAAEETGASSSSASSAAKTPIVSAPAQEPQQIGEITEEAVTERVVDPAAAVTGACGAPAPLFAAKKGKGPVRQLTARLAGGRQTVVGHRGGNKLGVHQRHHSTVFGQAARGALARSKSSAAITTIPNIDTAVVGPSCPVLQQSISSSRLAPPSAVSSAKTIVAPTSPPRLPEPAPAPAPPASSPVLERAKPQSPPVTTKTSKRAEPAPSSDFETTDTEGDDSSWASDYSDEGDEPETGNIAKEAAVEAARQRDMFAKVPQRSYTDLAKQPQNPGLLTSLFHPDPALLPHLHMHHPFRAHNSAMNLGSRPAPVPPSNVTGLQMSKSSAAVPLAAQVTVTQTQVGVNPSGRPGYRLKGRPEGQEYDESSDEDGEDDAVPLSKSVAQRKLEVLAGLRNKRLQQQAAPSHGGPRHQRQPRLPSQLRMTSTSPADIEDDDEQQQILPTHETTGEVMRTTSAPIVLPHPYNLPAPAPPATPRTTRREMLATEMSESLRRQILWERETNRRIWRRSGSTANAAAAVDRKPPVAVYGNDAFHASGW